MKSTRHKQSREEGDDGQLWKPESLNARHICCHHPLDCVLLFLQAKHVEVFAVAPTDRDRDQDIREDSADLL